MLATVGAGNQWKRRELTYKKEQGYRDAVAINEGPGYQVQIATKPASQLPKGTASRCKARLLRRRHQTLPRTPVHLYTPRASPCDGVDREHDIPLVNLADGNAGVASHGAVD